ncbi:unnamed protein product, partial [Strongylus vulgaris]
MERAKLMEKHSEEIRLANLKKARRNSSPRQSSPRREVEVARSRKEYVEPGRGNAESPSDETPQLEWWEKKPTWQQK